MGGCCKCFRKYGYILFFILSVILFLTAFVIDRYGPGLLEKKVKQNLLLVNGSTFFDSFVHMRNPRFVSIYVFEVRNPDDVLHGKRPIILREVGPFVFQKFEVTENLTFHEEMSEVSFFKRTYYTLRRDKTNMSAFYRNMTIINQDFMTSASYLYNHYRSKWSWLVKFMVQEYMKRYQEGLFLHKSPHDFIVGVHSIGFGFYKDFGVISADNDTRTGEYRIHTGVRDAKLVGQTISFEEKVIEDCWGESPPSCNEIRGTDGSIFERPITKYSTPTIYVPQMRTSLNGVYEKEVITSDITMLQFNLFQETMISPLRHPPNYCYCERHNVTAFPNYCPSDGLLDMSGCREADIVISQPHFLNGHAVFLSMFEGLSPDAKKHESYIHIEPRFGVTTSAQVAYQFNIDISIMKEFEGYENITSTIFPSYYQIESAQADDESLEVFKKYTRVLWLLEFLPWTFTGLGVLSLVFTTALCVYSCFESSGRKHNMKPIEATTSRQNQSRDSISSRDNLVPNPSKSSKRMNQPATPASPSLLSIDSQQPVPVDRIGSSNDQIHKTNNKSSESVTTNPDNIIG